MRPGLLDDLGAIVLVTDRDATDGEAESEDAATGAATEDAV